MRFENAIEEMRKGKKIRNEYMKEKHIVMYMKKGHIYEFISTPTHSREYECPFINSNHLFRDDWEILDE